MSEENHHLFNLADRVAVVTGGGSGLGREFCEILAEFGAAVACLDLRRERAEETCAAIKQYGHAAVPIDVDVSHYDQVEAAFRKVGDIFGRLDVLVNNAGILTPPALIHQMDVEQWHKLLGVSLHGVFYCMREGLGMMVKQRSGSIINIASVAGVCALDPDIEPIANYVTAKSGVIGLTKQGAAEYGQHNIRVNCIAPGWHRGTRLAQDAGIVRTEEITKNFERALISKTPMKRMGEPDELKGLLLYLASDASSFLTGQIIAHDGGWTCWH